MLTEIGQHFSLVGENIRGAGSYRQRAIEKPESFGGVLLLSFQNAGVMQRRDVGLVTVKDGLVQFPRLEEFPPLVGCNCFSEQLVAVASPAFPGFHSIIP
jgi:hypothetical protein